MFLVGSRRIVLLPKLICPTRLVRKLIPWSPLATDSLNSEEVEKKPVYFYSNNRHLLLINNLNLIRKCSNSECQVTGTQSTSKRSRHQLQKKHRFRFATIQISNIPKGQNRRFACVFINYWILDISHFHRSIINAGIKLCF